MRKKIKQSFWKKTKSNFFKEETSIESNEITFKDTMIVAAISIFLVPFFLVYKIGLKISKINLK